jgi:hypothetical protein
LVVAVRSRNKYLCAMFFYRLVFEFFDGFAFEQNRSCVLQTIPQMGIANCK